MRRRWFGISNWQDAVATLLGSALAVAMVAFLIVFTNPRAVAAVQYLGLALFAAAGVMFAFHLYSLVLPRRRKSWGYVGGLVGTDLYSVVRHPLYVGVIVLYVGAIAVGQSWPVAVVALAGIAVMYWNMLLEERSNVGRFGHGYVTYMRQVPRANVFLGLVRLLRRRRTT